jgi:hypothetical protein
VIRAATSHDAVQAVNVDWYCDVPRYELEVLAQELYGVGPENPLWEPFLGFLGSLGLKQEGGSPKQAYQIFVDAIDSPAQTTAVPLRVTGDERRDRGGLVDDAHDPADGQGRLRPDVLVGAPRE